MSAQNAQEVGEEGGSSSHHEGLCSLSPRSEVPVSPHSEGGAPPRNQQLIPLCDIGHDGSSSTTIAGRTTCTNTSGGSTQGATASEDDVRRAKFASALHLPMSNGGKSPRSPSHSSLGIDITRLPPMHISSEDAYEDSSSNQSDNDDEEASNSPHASAGDGNNGSDKDDRRGRRVRRVLAEAASSPSLGSIDDNKSSASPRSFNLQPRPNRHSPSSPNESTSAGLFSSAVETTSSDRSIDSACTRPPSSFGRISPHLHLDLSCVAVPPLNAFSSSNGGTRCRSDSEATLGSEEDSTASVAAGVRQPPQQVGSARPSIQPPPWAVAAKGEAKLEVSMYVRCFSIYRRHPSYMNSIPLTGYFCCYLFAFLAGVRIAWDSDTMRSYDPGLLPSWKVSNIRPPAVTCHF